MDPVPIAQIILPACVMSIFWSILTGGDLESLVVGVPAVVLATAAAVRLRSPCGKRLHWQGLLRFIPYFLYHSVTGSIDVAWRAIHPQLPLTPTTRDYRLRLPPDGPSRPVFVAVLGLLPGTLAADLYGDTLTVHVLDAHPSTWEGVYELEQRIADLFGLDLAPRDFWERTVDG
jgi:multicomponent Na+:H+ antiporter subunit E